MGIDEDLDQLEDQLRRLQVEWEKFFAGVEKRPPGELKARVEALIRRHAFVEIRNNTSRFRYQNLTARYNVFNELWQKRLRALEEGRPIAGQPPRLAPPREAPAPPERRAPAECRVRDVASDAEAVRGLFERFIEERRTTGEPVNVKFDSFQKLIQQQLSRIQSQKGVQAVNFRLETKDGKVALKAKAVR